MLIFVEYSPFDIINSKTYEIMNESNANFNFLLLTLYILHENSVFTFYAYTRAYKI